MVGVVGEGRFPETLDCVHHVVLAAVVVVVFVVIVVILVVVVARGRGDHFIALGLLLPSITIQFHLLLVHSRQEGTDATRCHAFCGRAMGMDIVYIIA